MKLETKFYSEKTIGKFHGGGMLLCVSFQVSLIKRFDVVD